MKKLNLMQGVPSDFLCRAPDVFGPRSNMRITLEVIVVDGFPQERYYGHYTRGEYFHYVFQRKRFARDCGGPSAFIRCPFIGRDANNIFRSFCRDLEADVWALSPMDIFV